ncbi:sensor domain-containing diguanylate cyclase [Microbaculum marinum]|uniref:diguanylate cyclase n=1 Tax=Microbaculum marinum TaxID=1764581 RepID=A0AAW9RCX9_9HYPH
MISGFRTRLMALLLLAVAPVFGVQFWEIWQQRENALAEAKERAVFLARQAAIRQADLIGDTRALLNIVKSIPAIRDFEGPDCETYLRGIADARPWIQNMGIADADGIIRCSVTPDGVGISIADRTYYRRAVSRHTFVVSDVLIGRVSRRPTVVAALPSQESGRTVMYLATLKLSWIEDLAVRVAADLNGDIFVVDLTGQMLASHIRFGVNASIRETGNILNELASDREGLAIFAPDQGNAILFGYATIPDTTARIFVGIPYATILNSVHLQTRNGLRDLAIAFVVILVLAWVGGEILLIGPIRSLDVTTRKIAGGDYGTRADESRGPAEFRRLGQTFNRMVSRLETLADADPLTGLANRRQLDRRLGQLWKQKPNTPVAIAMIDVDHFKHFNDHYGHLRGDECLRTLAAVIRSRARRADDLAARYGGEEFTLVVPGMSGEEMSRHCENLRATIEGLAIQRPEGAGPVTVSIGIVSTTPSETPDINRAIRKADEALYAAKGAGRNRVYTHEEREPEHAQLSHWPPTPRLQALD